MKNKALHIKAIPQVIKEVFPKNGKDFSLEELKQYIGGGYIEIVRCKGGQIMVIDEEGKLKGLPINPVATMIYGNPNDIIVGDVLLCPDKMVK